LEYLTSKDQKDSKAQEHSITHLIQIKHSNYQLIHGHLKPTLSKKDFSVADRKITIPIR